MKINYPNPTINNERFETVKSHGMLFENSLNISNEYYRIHEKAIIYKKPTPIQVVKVNYPMRSQAKIVEAYYKTPSTTDYNGIYRGKYIDYEAKETNNSSFAFKHIFDHQIKHLVSVYKAGGIAFVIIYFRKFNEVHIISIRDFYDLFIQGQNGGRKSISIETARKIGVQAKLGYTPPIDYLSAVDKLFFS